MSKFLVGIDAGHGMNKAGKRTPVLKDDLYIDGKLVRKKGSCIHEFEWNIGVSKYLADALIRCGIDYVYLMDEDGSTDTPLSTRASKANNKKCDIAVSHHYNAYGGCNSFLDRKGGLLVLRTKNCSSKSIKLGELIAKQLEKNIDYGYSYGLRRDVDISGFTLAILRQTNMPAVLIEYGFMDVLKEAKLMLDTKHQKKCAESVCKAICEYFGVTYKEGSSDTTNSVTEKAVNQEGLVNATSLNVRSGPGTNYSKIGSLKNNTQVTIAAKCSNGWLKIKLNNDYGYVSGNYIDNIKDISTKWENRDYNCKVRATANLNLRTGRGTNNSIITTIKKGTVFEVGYVYNNWGSTWDFKGQVGYFCCDYIERV